MFMRAAITGAFLLFIHDDGRYANSPHKEFFDHLKSAKGLCCSDADGALVKDADWDTKDGHYRVMIGGKWWDVPDSAVITAPNPIGTAMVWGYPVGGFGAGSYEIRCFMPGSMT